MNQRNQRSVQANKKELQIKNEKELDLTVFKKEKCQVVARKTEIDDRKIGGKKTTMARSNYNMLNTNQENELLGVRTGLKVYSEKPKPVAVDAPKKEEVEEKKEEKKEEKEETPKRKYSGRAERKQSGELRRGGRPRGYQKEGYLKPDERKAGVKPKSSRGGRTSGQGQARTTGPKINIDDNAFPTL